MKGNIKRNISVQCPLAPGTLFFFFVVVSFRKNYLLLESNRMDFTKNKVYVATLEPKERISKKGIVYLDRKETLNIVESM